MTSDAAVLTAAEVAQTAEWIASVQLPSGQIPWYPGGHADPWNHTEAAMALAVAGRVEEAEAAYDWLRSTQLPDGSWCLYYLADGVEEPRRDPNVCAYVAAGTWWHFLTTGDRPFVDRMWPVVERAVEFVLGLQRPSGEIVWSRDADGVAGRFALLTANASIHHSLRCAVALAAAVGEQRPDWELAAAQVGAAVAHRPSAFLSKDSWAMDWYYPVLGGALTGERAAERIDGSWNEFVMPGVGVRCVVTNPWVTAAETAECVMALDAIGRRDQAAELLSWTGHLRDHDGAYWTGCVHPQCVRYPGGERSTYTSAAVILADHVLSSSAATAGLFRGETLGPALDLGELETSTDR
ncbi:hypothetical protein K6U06_21365 [Acidiferrimicrobium sp. IK]|uniref:prenyltransferase/squalene oxidase repeat-containing protein n=1 Tax=Acidiferrimicrobium sp. IK TaxID=2871700 RepID=UPI0021CB9315|nr:prenyltransferase/squalene oxidase repeat-containing protein [Acidiferrimicrobium sp. IK]MCU4186929.1 hypothetical protein [Acidiferrimicrobium sp. IK]